MILVPAIHLSSLKKIPLDQLKIDQSFVRDLTIDRDDAVIVQTIIAMAGNLGMGVIAVVDFDAVMAGVPRPKADQ